MKLEGKRLKKLKMLGYLGLYWGLWEDKEMLECFKKLKVC
jgi:hypothetical protein